MLDESKKYVGFQIDDLSRLMRKATYKSCMEKDFDMAVVQQGWIIGYLHHCMDSKIIVCQKDLENKFHLPKSTITDILQMLEKKGLVNRIPVENDARRKQIVLTKSGVEFSENIRAQIDATEQIALEGISKEEKEQFFNTLMKMTDNIAKFAGSDCN